MRKYNPEKIKTRDQRIMFLYKHSGLNLAEIGRALGMTRENVRQRIEKIGKISPLENGGLDKTKSV